MFYWLCSISCSNVIKLVTLKNVFPRWDMFRDTQDKSVKTSHWRRKKISWRHGTIKNIHMRRRARIVSYSARHFPQPNCYFSLSSVSSVVGCLHTIAFQLLVIMFFEVVLFFHLPGGDRNITIFSFQSCQECDLILPFFLCDVSSMLVAWWSAASSFLKFITFQTWIFLMS